MKEKGISLIIVLWILMILTGIFSSAIYINRLELKKAKYQIDRLKALGIAKAGMEIALFELFNDKNDYDAIIEKWKTNPEKYQNIKFGEGNYNVTVEDEESKININTASKNLLETLCKNRGIQNTNEITDSISDWRDTDSITGTYGAENDYYNNLIPKQFCKNAPFDHIEELISIKGFENKNTFNKIKDFITTHSVGKINLNTAPIEVLRTLPETNETVIKNIISTREITPFQSSEQIKSVIGNIIYEKIYSFITIKSYNFKIKSAGNTNGISKIIEVVLEKKQNLLQIKYYKEI